MEIPKVPIRQFYACTRSGGSCIITVRDYEAEDTTGRKVKLYDTREDNGITFMIFQRWNFHGAVYDLSMYFIEDDGGAHCRTRVMRSRYYAIGTARLIELMAEAVLKM